MTSRVLPTIQHGDRGPLLIAMHWLGGSAQTWTEVAEIMSARGCRFVAVDLPGFGNATQMAAFSLEEMANAVSATIKRVRSLDEPWLLVGHSMGGKVSAVVARMAEDGDAGLEHFAGMILVSPSPAGPEPMEESKRAEMLTSLGQATADATENEKRAEKFIDDNTGKLPLIESVKLRSVDDVLRMNRSAFTAWLTSGSKEDWAARVGVLETPALVLAGDEEEALGPDAQRKHTVPHFKKCSLTPLVGGGHLAPLERPHEVAEHMTAFLSELGLAMHPRIAELGPDFRALIRSNATAPQTRRVLEERMIIPSLPSPEIFTAQERGILRRLVDLVIPAAPIDLAVRIEAWLGETNRDGWRFDALPMDDDAWRRGLCSLEAAATREFEVPFVALDFARQNDLLKRASDGELGKGFLASLGLKGDKKCLDAQQMQRWFEDVRSELTRMYVSDPRTMERIGFAGFADEKGFTHIKLNELQEFEL
jgi:pimeloyl-ACP methyl ester carboxylesterase